MPLSANARRMLFSNLCEVAAGPLAGIFITAFIWRTTGSFLSVSLYSMALFVFLPFGMWVNAHILRHMKMGRAFPLGAALAGASTAMVVFFKGGGPAALLAYGALFGVCNGMYWGNRHYLELQETVESERQYFFSTIFAGSWTANVVMPIVAGWFIVLAPSLGWYSYEHAYWFLFALAFMLMLGTAAVMAKGKFGIVDVPAITRFGTPLFKNDRRLLSIAEGTVDGMGFLTPLIILIFIGSEGILGTILSLVSFSTAITMYLYGRYADPRNWRKILVASNAASLLCAISLIVLRSPWSTLIYVLFANASSSFFSLSIQPFLYSSMEKEMAGDTSLRYAFTFDNEFLLNVGRVIGIGIMLIVAETTTASFGIMHGPIIAGILQAILLGIFLLRGKKVHGIAMR